MIETWKVIPGFEKYKVSNYGKVKSYHKKQDGYIMSQSDDKDGYKKVTLTKDGVEYTRRVHILVALAFIPNPNNLSVINHKNGKKYDNNVENLEWSTVQKNTIHGYETGLNKNIGKTHHHSQKYEIYRENELIACYDNTFQIEKALYTNRATINRCIENDELFYDELKVVKVSSFTKIVNLNKDFNLYRYTESSLKPIAIFDKENHLLSMYSSLSTCEKLNNFSRKTLKDRLVDNKIYKKKYLIKPIKKFTFLTSNPKLINQVIG